MSIRKTLKLSKIKQLIDLNQNFINFNAQFQVTNKTPNIDYKMLVVNQEQLDDTNFNIDEAYKNIEWEKTNGVIGGSVLFDKNIFQHWFISLKSDTECDIDIMIDLQKLPDDIPQQDIKESMIDSTQQNPEFSVVQKPFYKVKSTWIIIGIIVVLFFSLFFFYKSNKDSTVSPIVPDISQTSVTETTPSQVVVKSVSNFKPPMELTPSKKLSIKGKN